MRLFKTDLFVSKAEEIESMYVEYSIFDGWKVMALINAKDLGDGTYITMANLSTHKSEEEAREALKEYSKQLEEILSLRELVGNVDNR